MLQLAGGGLAYVATKNHRTRLAQAQIAGQGPVALNENQPSRESGLSSSRTIFTALLTSWDHPDLPAPHAEVRIQGADGSWSDWRALHVDHHVPPSPGAPIHFNPVLIPGVNFDVRTENPADADFLRFSTVDTSAAASSLLGSSEDGDPLPLIDGFIIPRANWGANEDYRHIAQDPNNPTGWPPSYREIKRVIVHHTETEFGWSDPAEVVRSIYYYHALTLGWTDIGYNFLIDVYGNVYEGRYGGPGVVGGHALEYNPGSIGVALIGSFDDEWPPIAAQEALVRLIRTRASDVDPAIAADWLDWGAVPNICGHGDVVATDCPGSDLHAVLPAIRGELAGTTPVYFPAPVRLYDPQLVSFSAGPSLIDPDELIEVRATIVQDGREALISQGPEPGFIYEEGEDFDIVGHGKIEGRFRLAVDLIGEDGVRNPYRWGFGAAVESGEEREVVGYIRARDMGTKRLTASIVQEFVRYYDDEELFDSVHVVHPYVSRAKEVSSPGARYFVETGHNVPSDFYDYWTANGGLSRFGFPLTEPFSERSLTDGELYLTQYFERGRFEYHPELEAVGESVKLGLLGREATAVRHAEEPFQPIEPFESTEELWYFSETLHSTSYRFLEYWIANGGIESFGYPISEKFEEASLTDGRARLVQYFERARFEYHPDDEWTKQIKLGHLGREFLIRRGWLPGAGIED